MQKKKTPNPNLAKIDLSCKSKDIFIWREKPISMASLDQLAQDLKDWVDKDESAFKISQFLLKRGIWPNDIPRWRERNENFDSAYTYAMIALGNKREIGALTGKLHPGMVIASMAMYDPEWKANAEWRAKLTEKNVEGNGAQIVVIEKFPDSPLVPEKHEARDTD